ncbi:polymorphic toxin type 23 domain-containing protein [Dyadobacter bucti]|uniref:polymorphic toxin type 23 domain-containing protein n=1 Tax=Dyadobacter bucti TaxID=2572203 RepID=UPI001E2E78DD|nr:polymorphic toxin type 23 domain-containing protein [Dyadobacter bucti]
MKKCLLLTLLLLTFVLQTKAQNIDYNTPLFTNQTFSKTVNPALPVGGIAGAGGVSGSGGATYSIPIAVPPGTNGVVPSISVVYHSLTGNGPVGNGWGIAGLSGISRSGQTSYHDGQVTAIDFTSKDRFNLDGQMLLGVSGVYGADGATYSTESEQFSTVTSNGVSGAGPTWFKIITKDGVEMEYGNTSDSRMMDEANTNVVFWKINRIRNPDGNYIEFKYLNNDRESRIDEINYTGNTITGLVPYNKIKFSYKIRADINAQYIGNSLIVNKYLLDKIAVTAEGNIVKSYQFNYSWDNITSYLREVVETGSDGLALNSTIFKYGQMPDPFQSWLLANQLTDASDTFFGDFNGDGKADLLAAIIKNAGPYTNYHSKFQTFLSQSGTSALTPGPTVDLAPNYTMIKGAQIPNDYNILANDYTGDGLDDVMTLKITNTGNYNKLDSIIIYESTNAGAAYNKHLRSVQPNFFKIHPKGNFFFPGDFDGDGITEYIAVLGNVLNDYLPFLCTNYIQGGACGSIGISGPTGFQPGQWADTDQAYVVDFNGDGKSDLMLIKDNLCEIFTFEGNTARRIYSSNFPTKNHLVYFGDFNADRKTDLLVRNSLTDNAATWTKAISTGAIFIPSTFTWAQVPEINNEFFKNHHVNLADYNGDGKTDIYHGKNNANLLTSKLNIYYSRGTDFHHIQSDHAKSVSSSPSYIADTDGDGRAEVISVEYYLEPYRHFKFKPSGKEHLIHKAANGYGHISTWYYKTLSEGGDFYLKGASAPYPFTSVQPPVYAAFQFIAQNGIGGENTLQYKYEDARLHRAGKGLLGLKKMIASDLVTGQKSVVENEFNTTYYVAVPKKTSLYLTAGNTLLSETTFSNEFIPQGPNGSKRFLHRVKSVTENNVFEGRTVTSTNNTFDNFGNVTQNTVNNSNVETTVTNTVFGAYPGIIPNKPTSVTVIKTRTGQPAFSAATGMGYNAVGQLTSKTDFSGLPKSVSTAYEYFPLGNLKKTTVTPSGLPARTTSAVYDAKGRYATSTVNELGQTSSATYDPKWGKPLTVTGIDGLTTTMEYDGFGREKKTTFPQGYSVNQTYGWDISGNSVWYAKTTHPGKPDVKTWYDLLGREIKTETEGFQGQTITQTNTYDAKGNLSTSTAPYKTGEPVLTTTTQYDAHNRPVNISSSGPFGTTTIGYNYSAGKLTTTTTTPSGTSSKTTDATGQVTSATDNGGTLGYTYYSHGGLKEVSNGAATLTSSQYDAYGRQTSLADLNAGTTTYDYNALGQLASQTNANNKTHTMQYDLLGRNTSRTGPEGITTYEYYPTGSGASVNQIKKVTGFAGNLEEYTYDAFGRLQTSKQTVDAAAYTTTYGYNMYDDVTSVLYPSGFGTNHVYDSNGYPTTIKNTGNTVTLYTNNGISGLGQNTSYALGNGKTSAVSYEYGVPKKFTTSGIQDLELSWDYAKGNLTKRKDYVKNKEESFTYDNLDRLLTATVAGKAAQTIAYQPSGNISSKSDAGQTFSYHQTKIHALTGIVSPTTAIPVLTQDITYTAFNQPEKIIENGSGQPYELTYTYGADYQRLKGTMKKNNALINTHYYFGNGYEKDVTPAIADKHLHYIGSPAGLVAIVIRENNVDQYYYTYTDHLGSLLTTTAANGTVLLDQNFDAWGRLRHPANWDYANVPAPASYLYRGFTGHEHLTNFNLINMNGRMYDPVVGRVLSVDNYVQDPFGTQSYNRYSYSNNNPLRYTDPSGEIFQMAYFAAAFTADFASNLLNGVDNPGKVASRNASNAVNGLSSSLQFQIYSNGNTSVTAGINPLAMGISASVYHTKGNITTGLNVGINITGDFSINGSTSISAGGWNIGIGGGGGNNHFAYGGSVNYKGYGAGYYQTRYGSAVGPDGNPNNQVVGGASLSLGKASFRIENDFFAFNHQDRWRSNALEIGIGDFVIGTRLYNNDPKGEGQKVVFDKTDRMGNYNQHKFGAWENGKTYNAPLWVGHRFGNSIERIGFSHPMFQDRTQNFIHLRFPPGRQNFYVDYSNFQRGIYLYSCYYNPYSLWGK